MSSVTQSLLLKDTLPTILKFLTLWVPVSNYHCAMSIYSAVQTILLVKSKISNKIYYICTIHKVVITNPKWLYCTNEKLLAIQGFLHTCTPSLQQTLHCLSSLQLSQITVLYLYSSTTCCIKSTVQYSTTQYKNKFLLDSWTTNMKHNTDVIQETAVSNTGTNSYILSTLNWPIHSIPLLPDWFVNIYQSIS